MVGIIGGVCFAAGALAHWICTEVQKSAAESEAKRRERAAHGGLTPRQYHMRYNDVFAQAMKTGGKQQ